MERDEEDFSSSDPVCACGHDKEEHTLHEESSQLMCNATLGRRSWCDCEEFIDRNDVDILRGDVAVIA